MKRKKPKLLYKYLGPSGFIALDSLTFRFTKPRDLNDPFEARVPVFLKSSSGGLSYGLTNYGQTEVLAPPQRSILKLINDKYGITCFSEVPNNLLMWAHYGQSHSGLVLGVNARHSSFTSLGDLITVKYSASRPKLSSLKRESELLKVLSVKSQDWSYEKEWRLVALLDDCILSGELFLKTIDPDSIVQVILGANASDYLTTRIESWQRKHPNVELLRYRLDSYNFQLYPDKNLHHEPVFISSGDESDLHLAITPSSDKFSVGIIETTPEGTVARDYTEHIMNEAKKPRNDNDR